MKRKSMMGLAVAVVLGACSGGGSSAPPSPGSEDAITVSVQNNFSSGVEISSLWAGSRNPSRLGTVRPNQTEEFTFFYRSGDLRMVVESMAFERTGTSNAYMFNADGRGRTLLLVIDSRFDLELGELAGGGEH
jgi:hypothetical protein